MPKLRNLANRTKELEIFLKMAAGDYDCCIMLIEGASGMGKTSLLSRFKQECPSRTRYVPFDCKGVVSIAAFLSQMVVDLGYKEFPNFVRKVQESVEGGVDFSENNISAEKTISIAINSNNLDIATNDYRLERLEQAFFDDLAALNHRTIVTLDTYQLANDMLKDWIESKWLRAVERQLDAVVTVIAGQTTPNPNNSVWGDRCEYFSLTSIVEVDAWCKFCLDLSLELSEESIKTIALVGNGHPKTIHETLLEVVKRW